MDTRKWAHPITVGNVEMCPMCLTSAVEHAYTEMMQNCDAPLARGLWRGIAVAHLAALDCMSDEDIQLFSTLLADHVGDAEYRCRYRHVHQGGATVDKPDDNGGDDVPY